jgi:PAS domain S-box-containing protein
MALVEQRDRIFPGDTGMARRMRAFDWEHHELGPPERWPQSLRTSVRIALTSRQAMCVWWGPRLINLYNDAYAAFLCAKHPGALGQPAATVWPEIWEQIGPRAEFAMRQESGTYDEALPFVVQRRGHPEEVYCTFSYSPIPDDDGDFGGILCPVSEDTARIIGERQLAVLRELAARSSDARTWQDACHLAASALETNPADLPFALIYVVDPETPSAVLSGSAVIERGTALAPETIALEDESIWPIGEVVQTQRVVPVSIRSPLRLVTQALVLPLPPSGSMGKGGVLVVGLNPLRAFDDGYQRFLGLVANGIAAAITNGAAYEQERKRAEALAELDREAVGREQALRRAILDSMADTFYAVDAEWQFKDFNRHAEVQLRLLGKDPDSLIGKRVWDEFDNPPVEEVFRRVMRERVPVTHEHYYPPLGEWVENRIYPTPDGGLAVFQRYVTERKRAEEELRRGAAYLADSQQLSHTGSWAFNPRTGAIFWSSEHYRIFGLDPDGPPPTYEGILAQVHADDRLRLEQAFADAATARGDYAFDLRVIRPDGTTRYIRSLARPVFDEAGALTEYVGTIIDMTERHVAEEALHTAQAQLAQMARLTTIGELAASLAHEINQPLTAIVTNGGASLGVLDRASPEIGKAADAIRAVIENAERAGQVIAAARSFLRKSSGALTAVDMNAVIRDVLVVVTPEIRRQDVVLRTELSDDIPAVMAVAVQMQQVVLNLVMNAVEAMGAVTERRRELVVRCLRNEIDGHNVVCVEVEDSGIGVAPAEVHRVFEAFYTTKPDGLGMGLAISRSIVQAHGGRLWATLHARAGVTFQFTIPAASVSGT